MANPSPSIVIPEHIITFSIVGLAYHFAISNAVPAITLGIMRSFARARHMFIGSLL